MRKANEAKAKIHPQIARATLQSLLSAQQVNSEAQHADEIEAAQKRSMSLEKELKRVFLHDFADKLHMAVDEYSPEG